MTDLALAQRSASRIHRVVAGVDLDDPFVVDRLVRLPLAPGAQVTLVNVLEGGADKRRKLDVANALRASAASVLARRADLAVDVAVPRGDIAMELARSAAETGAEVVLVGRGGGRWRALFPRASLGERVARRSQAPVLIVSPRARPYERVLALLESAGVESAGVYDLARALLGDAAAECDVVHPVARDLERRMLQRGAPRRAALTARRWLRATHAQELRSWLGRVEETPRLRLWVVSSDPAEAVRAIAATAEPDLLAVCVDRRWLSGHIRGSLVGRLIASVDRDVLVGRAVGEVSATRVSHPAAA